MTVRKVRRANSQQPSMLELLDQMRKERPRIPQAPVPTRLIQVGTSFVDPTDVAAIVAIASRPGLYVIRLKSQPDPEYPFWAEESELDLLLREFNLVTM